MSSSKRTNVPPKEWAKHLRPFGKNRFWSSVRNLFRSEEMEEMILETDPEELKRNKEEYERELRASLNGEEFNTDDYVQRMANTNKLCENGVQPLTPIEKPQLPIAVTHPIHLSILDRIKANAETVHVFFPDKEEKPLPKIVTIEVSGVVGVGKTYLLQMIDDAIQAKFGVVPLCGELEDEARQINVNEIPQHLIDDYKSGKIVIEMREKPIKPNSILTCPCPGCGE